MAPGGAQVSGSSDYKRSKSQNASQSAPSAVGFEKQFEFIDGLNSRKGVGRKKTRSFVTKQHYRQKRFERGTKREGEGGQASGTEVVAFAADVSGNFRVWDIDEVRPFHGIGSTLPEPLGGGRADPFNSYPIPATRDVHELVDHYSFVIPSLVHKHWSRAVRRPRSCWDLFDLYRHNEIPFLGMLHHAAHHLARLRGFDSTLQSIEFKHQSLAAINRSLRRKNGPCSDSTLVGIGLLANAERLWGDRETARMHWGALKRLLIERGGFPALKGNPTMHTKLVWSFIALSWPSADGNPAYVYGFSEMAGNGPTSSATDPMSPFEQSCEEFADFFKRRKMQVLKTLPATSEQQNRFRIHKYRNTTFKDGTTIFTALSEIETGYESPDKRRAVDNCRMACLIYLNLIIAEYGELSRATEEYLKVLRQVADDKDDDSSLTAEHLLWTLLTPFKHPGHYERIWKVCRLVGVVKRAKPQTWSIIGNALQIFLQMPEDIRMLEDVLGDWNCEPPEFSGHIVEEPGFGSAAAKVLWRHQSQDIMCSESCLICPLKPVSF